MNEYQFLENQAHKPLLIEFGELGTCQLACRKSDKEFFVLKILMKKEAEREIKCLTRLRHPNIIQVIDYFNHEDTTLLIFQFFENGDLYTKIKCKQIKPEIIPNIFRDLVHAIDFIHSRNIIHRNLKTQNVMLTQKMKAKIMDFGLAARLTTRKTVCGCLYYMAPQILLRKPYNSKVDVWALGIILYEMVFSEVPFEGTSAEQIVNSIKNGTVYRVSSQEGSLLDLIQMMLSINPQKRPSPLQILSHPYLKQKKEKSQRPRSTKFVSHKVTERLEQESEQKIEEGCFGLFCKGKLDALCDKTETEKKFNFSLKKIE